MIKQIIPMLINNIWFGCGKALHFAPFKLTKTEVIYDNLYSIIIHAKRIYMLTKLNIYSLFNLVSKMFFGHAEKKAIPSVSYASFAQVTLNKSSSSIRKQVKTRKKQIDKKVGHNQLLIPIATNIFKICNSTRK